MKSYTSLCVAGALLFPLASIAGPSSYVYTPTVTYGEKEIDFKLGSASTSGSPRESASSIGFGYGAKDWWFTEVYLKYKRELNSTKLDAVEWENKFQLTESGKYPVDVGFLLEIERPFDHAEGWEVKWGPLFQAEHGKIQANANLLIERSYRAAAPSATTLMYQWQLKYRWLPQFEYGLQGLGELGKWDNWSAKADQSHQIGPAVFGKVALGAGQAIKYNAAWLLKTSGAAPDHTLRLQVEYEF